MTNRRTLFRMARRRMSAFSLHGIVCDRSCFVTFCSVHKILFCDRPGRDASIRPHDGACKNRFFTNCPIQEFLAMETAKTHFCSRDYGCKNSFFSDCLVQMIRLTNTDGLRLSVMCTIMREHSYVIPSSKLFQRAGVCK